MTGRPGIAFATRGPGATNASIGVHVARQDSRPMILFVGDVDRATRDREAFQEINFEAMFAPIAKWAARIDEARRLPEYVARAYAPAMSGRPGQVRSAGRRVGKACVSKFSARRAPDHYKKTTTKHST